MGEFLGLYENYKEKNKKKGNNLILENCQNENEALSSTLKQKKKNLVVKTCK